MDYKKKKDKEENTWCDCSSNVGPLLRARPEETRLSSRGQCSLQRGTKPTDTREPEAGGEQPLNMIGQCRYAAGDMDEDSDGVLDEDVLDDWFIESLKM